MSQKGPPLDHVLNRLHQGSSRIVIGEIPISFAEKDSPPHESINALITGFIAPGLVLKYETDPSYKAMVHIPVQEDNQYDDRILTVNMIADDRLESWWCLYRYMKTIQSGQTGGFPELDLHSQVYDDNGNYKNRLSYIPSIDIIVADGSMQRNSTLSFKRCFPIQLGDLQFTSNTSEPSPVTFTVSFVYSDRDLIRDPGPSADIIPPRAITD